jgi:uncharacterized membrane protein
MIDGIGDAFGNFIGGLVTLCIIFVPLGIWKFVEIIIWLFTHVKISW